MIVESLKVWALNRLRLGAREPHNPILQNNGFTNFRASTAQVGVSQILLLHRPDSYTTNLITFFQFRCFNGYDFALPRL